MAKKKLTEAERAKFAAERERMLANAPHELANSQNARKRSWTRRPLSSSSQAVTDRRFYARSREIVDQARGRSAWPVMRKCPPNLRRGRRAAQQ